MRFLRRSLLPLLLLLQFHDAYSANIYGQTNYGRRTVSDRLQSLERSVDADHDRKVTPQELVQWARTLGRTDPVPDPVTPDVSCVEQAEFEAGMVASGFSDLFAKGVTDFLSRYSATPAAPGDTCTGLNTTTVLAGAANGTYNSTNTADFLNGFIKNLTDFCQDVSQTNQGVDLYTLNEDCTTLPNACATPPYGCEPVCLQYTLVATVGRTTGAFSDRGHYLAASANRVKQRDFVEKLESMFHDKDSDGTFSKDEQTEDLRQNFDTNHDGCVDEAEYKARMATALCGGFDFSDAYASARFKELTGAAASTAGAAGACQGINVTLPNGAVIPEENFINMNTQTLITMCEADATLYNTNEDCKQLGFTCRVEAKTSATMACKNYVAATATKGKDPAQDSSIKFFRFLAKFGAKYEDLFPEN